MKKRSISWAATFGLLSTLLLPVMPAVSAASAPSLSFENSTVSVAKGSNAALKLTVNPNGTSINTVNVKVTFPADKLSFSGLDKSGSGFDTIIPASPVAANGKVSFAAARLSSGATSDSTLVATLLFTAKADTGSAMVDLDGSQVAIAGKATDAATSAANVNFTPAKADGNSPVNISNIKVSDVTITSAKISWTTDQPTTGSVDFGSTAKYGLTVAASDLATSHTVDLGKQLMGKSTVHYRITANDANAQSKSTDDQTFQTVGYTVKITVNDKNGMPLTNTGVSVDDNTTAKTDSNGVVTVTNVAPGSQKVTVDGNKTQVIVVKAAIGDEATKTQSFTLVAAKKANTALLATVLAIALLVLALCIAYLVKQKRGGGKPIAPAPAVK